MSEVTSNRALVVGDYYHCFEYESGRHSIHQCRAESGGTKYLGSNGIWADDNNNQALARWRIFTVEVPTIETIGLCRKHHGIGFQSDCAVCKRGK